MSEVASEVLRYTSVVLNTMVCLWLFVRLVVYKRYYDREIIGLKLALIIYTAAIVVGTLQVIEQEYDVWDGVYVLIDLASLLMLFTLFINRGHPVGAPRHQSAPRWP